MYSVDQIVDPAIMGHEPSMHALFDYLREHDPVARCEHPDYEPFWVMTRHEDIKSISQQKIGRAHV